MDPRFLPHNAHLEDPERFRLLDPQLRALRSLPLVHRFGLLDRIPTDTPGIYSITGGRQIGKTTLLKQWMAELLDAGVSAKRIAYFTGELIDDHHSLVRIISEHLQQTPPEAMRYLLLDEITYVREWDKGVKYLADTGLLNQAMVILTGSDSVIIRDARTRFPGRRGKGDVADFHLFPLSFAEVIQLKQVLDAHQFIQLQEKEKEPDIPTTKALFAEFGNFLTHGGFLTAINDLAMNGRVLPATLATYADWIRGDVLKRGRHDHFLREIMNAIVERIGSQVTWNSLAQGLSVNHPATVSNYLSLLADMDVIYIQPALVEDKLAAAPKKARKLHFADPFISHAVNAWLHPTGDPYREQIVPALHEPRTCARLAESCAVSHLRRWYPTYYIKAAGEVDIAFVHQGKFWPVEVKWTQQIRPGELKQVAKYPNGCIWSRTERRSVIAGVPAEPLPVALARMALAAQED
ncbi:MAG: ATP-binding protein [Candidatus Eisenbacteria sp.]|nr:ATP-binding protein [Candidatus Eisenbacteria bacterium]